MTYSRMTPWYKCTVEEIEFYGFSSDIEREFGIPMRITQRHVNKGQFHYNGRWFSIIHAGKRPKIVG